MNNFKKIIFIVRKKKDAFTLVELVVTMIISGLLVLAAIQLILNFSKTSTDTENNNKKYTEKLQFHKAISADMQKALRIEHYDDETIFHLPENSSVSYVWDFDFIVRTVNETADTFFVKMDNWHVIKEKSTDLPYILELEIENDDNETELFRIVKEYDNEVMFNNSELKPY